MGSSGVGEWWTMQHRQPICWNQSADCIIVAVDFAKAYDSV